MQLNVSCAVQSHYMAVNLYLVIREKAPTNLDVRRCFAFLREVCTSLYIYIAIYHYMERE